MIHVASRVPAPDVLGNPFDGSTYMTADCQVCGERMIAPRNQIQLAMDDHRRQKHAYQTYRVLLNHSRQ